MRRFLLVDDEINVLHALQRAIRQCGVEEELRVEVFTDPRAALERSKEVAFDVVISDFRMPEMSGVEFLRAYRAIQPDSVRMILSASTEFDAVMSAINEAEVLRYIAKPWQPEEIGDMVKLALQRRDQAREDLRLVEELRAQLGKSSPQEQEAKRLEEQEPGIMQVNWGPDGSVRLDD